MDEATLQNAIAKAIHRVELDVREEAIEMIRRTPDLECPHCLRALAAAIHDPVIWAAIANARQVVELEQRPVVTRSVRAEAVSVADRWCVCGYLNSGPHGRCVVCGDELR